MSIISFNEISESSQIGEKGKNLGLMTNWGVPVPSGIVLTDLPTSSEWKELLNWWSEQKYGPLAIRSSACGEDSKEHSFAGQNETFLNVKTDSELKSSIEKCFASIYGKSSVAYREHFIGKDSEVKMNVVVQLMVEPEFSGVYFSVDPRDTSKDWLLEIVEGYGEKLVSGEVTPYKLHKDSKETIAKWKSENTKSLKEIGLKLKKKLASEIDMEWAVDKEGVLHILQVRPITASAINHEKVLKEELTRLKKENREGAMWDGGSFQEVPGLPSPLTFSLWQEAFAPNRGFHEALKELGYLGFVDEEFSPHESVFENVFGRAFINLEKTNQIFFGPIPYRLDPIPTPHLIFDYKKIDTTTVLRTPISLYHMIKVGFEVSSNRKKWISLIEKDLLKFQEKMQRPNGGDLYENWDIEQLRERLAKEINVFTTYSLKSTFILILLIQATTESLKKILNSVYKDKKKSDSVFNYWLAKDLKTVTSDMGLYFIKALEDSQKIPFFMARYGHRAPGELELSNPRWEELGDKSFQSRGASSYSEQKEKNDFSIDKEIESIKSYKRVLIKEEWEILKSLLELREKLKLEILRPYAHIRYLALEIGKRTGLGDLVFWLSSKELLEAEYNKDIQLLKSHAETKKEQYESFQTLSLPMIVSLDEIEEILNSDKDEELQKGSSLVGEPISPGIAKGIVKVIKNVSEIDLESLPEDCIIVTEATDPGWTPIFTRARGIVVEKGGVLSHCAIVAREMHIPAVSQVHQCYNILKDGDVVWLDGNNGRVIIK